MATIYWQVEKETFVPEKNYFKTEWVKISREETSQEIELENERYKWSNHGFYTLFIGLFGGFIALITFGALGEAVHHYFYWGCLPGGLMVVCGIFLPHAWFWEKEKELYYAYQDWSKEHEVELWKEARKEVDAYNTEQHQIAEAWRAAHPLEEKIRACLLDPKSSVDVANLARYYAEVYLKENQNF